MTGKTLGSNGWMPAFRTALSIALCAALVLLSPAGALAQQAAGQTAAVLNIVIVEGEGAVNNIRQRVAREPIVRIEDENRKPIAGATVVFLLPSDGASGSFPGTQNMLTVQTNQNGEAVARGLRPNNVAGDFTIRVTASYQGATATAVIGQTNALLGAAAGAAGAGAGAATAAGLSAKVLAIIGIAAAAAVGGGVYAATRSDGGSSGQPGSTPRTPTAISIGSPSVGAP